MEPKIPLPWEEKAAIGCLALLSLQEFHELVLMGIQSRQLGGAGLGPLAPALLFLVLLAGFALLTENRKGWWFCLLIMTALGLVHLALFGGWFSPSERIVSHWEVEVTNQGWIKRPSLTPLGLFWVLSRGAFLLAVPALLALGALRKRLSRP